MNSIENLSEFPQVVYNWTNITDEFFTAVNDLSLGELLHDQLFGLFEAMSAIEMMDPKMDAGMLCNRGNKKALSFDQALESGVLQMENLTNNQLIGIIDTTLACIVSWLEGHSLAQTVFTNLYLHKPYQIEDRILKAFSLSVYKFIDIIKEFLVKGMVYEEEDFQSLQYGYRLNPDISEQRIIGMLREIEEELHKKCRIKHSEDKSNVTANEDIGLYARIRFVRAFYQCLSSLLQQSKDEKANCLADCQRLLTLCSEMLVLMQNTVELGMKPAEENGTIMGFEPLINQRLLPPTFPRYTKIKSSREALSYFEDTMNRLKQVCRVTNYVAFNNALDFFLEFSKSGACILSRSILQLLYITHGTSLVFGTIAFVDVLREAARSFIQPPALMRTALSLTLSSQAKMYIDSFFSHCTRPFCILIQVCGHNRARQRDKLGNILEEFAAIQEEAERVDAYLHRLSLKCEWPQAHLACFGTWVLYHTLKVMIMYLLSGFELELYSVHEYYYIFWYLYEFLYGWLISALTRADSFILGQDAGETSKPRTNKKVKPKRKKSGTSKYRRDIVYYQALQNMCGGYYKALFGFRMDGKVTMPHPQFDSEQVRYEHRFAPFAGLLTPPPVQYAEFREMTSSLRYPQQPIDSMYLYIAGCKHFHQARSLLESVAPKDNEINDLLKVAKTNFVVLKLLAGGHKKDSTLPPEFDFSFHKHLPVIKLN